MFRGDRLSLLIRGLWAIGLFLGASTHAETIIQHGWSWDYGGMPWATRLFWSSLAILDPLGAVLLFVRPRAGVVATLCIMVADVLHNSWIMVSFKTWPAYPVFLTLQAAFLLFVLASAPLAWRRSSAAV